MDARELTKKYYELHDWKIEADKKIGFLEMENQKLRTIVNDMVIDLQMLQQTVERMRNA
jgi:hypothetical protein